MRPHGFALWLGTMSDTLRRNTAVGREAGTTRLKLVVRWLWVAVPLAWGILETVRASLAFLR
jgi:hypothetical protein